MLFAELIVHMWCFRSFLQP